MRPKVSSRKDRPSARSPASAWRPWWCTTWARPSSWTGSWARRPSNARRSRSATPVQPDLGWAPGDRGHRQPDAGRPARFRIGHHPQLQRHPDRQAGHGLRRLRPEQRLCREVDVRPRVRAALRLSATTGPSTVRSASVFTGFMLAIVLRRLGTALVDRAASGSSDLHQLADHLEHLLRALLQRHEDADPDPCPVVHRSTGAAPGSAGPAAAPVLAQSTSSTEPCPGTAAQSAGGDEPRARARRPMPIPLSPPRRPAAGGAGPPAGADRPGAGSPR